LDGEREVSVNWEAIAAVGETIGALAVVVTLLYVARDIRQNSRSLSISALRDSTAQWNQWSEMLAVSGDLADIVAKGNASYSSLSTGEHLRYGAYVQSFFDNVDSSRLLTVEHRIGEDMDVLASIAARRVEIPGFAAWWRENSADYHPEFVAWIDRLESSG
jgi:hypothetical protein